MTQRQQKPVLIVQHAADTHSAMLGRALSCMGVPTVEVHPYKGENFPLIGEISGVISLGGPMGAYEQHLHPWIVLECQLLKEAVLQKMPAVGICLGGQLLAQAMGGQVTKNPLPEVGWHPIEFHPSAQKDPLFKVLTKSTVLVYQWHQDTFSLPQGAELLAFSENCPRQAFRIGENAYGVQFHPEADGHMISEWIQSKKRKKKDPTKEPTVELDPLFLEAQAGGSKQVQNLETQMSKSDQGAKSHYRMIAGIAQLFGQIYNPQPFKRPKQTLPKPGGSMKFKVRGDLVIKSGTFVEEFEIPGAIFAAIRSRDAKYWVVRLDRLELVN